MLSEKSTFGEEGSKVMFQEQGKSSAMASSRILIDTKGVCFMCVNSCDPKIDFSCFKQLIGYLEIDISKFPLLIYYDEDEFGVILCENCHSIMEEFLEGYKIFQDARSRLNSCVRSVFYSLKGSDLCQGYHEDERLAAADALRKETLKKCSSKLTLMTNENDRNADEPKEDLFTSHYSPQNDQDFVTETNPFHAPPVDISYPNIPNQVPVNPALNLVPNCMEYFLPDNLCSSDTLQKDCQVLDDLIDSTVFNINSNDVMQPLNPPPSLANPQQPNPLLGQNHFPSQNHPPSQPMPGTSVLPSYFPPPSFSSCPGIASNETILNLTKAIHTSTKRHLDDFTNFGNIENLRCLTCHKILASRHALSDHIVQTHFSEVMDHLPSHVQGSHCPPLETISNIPPQVPQVSKAVLQKSSPDKLPCLFCRKGFASKRNLLIHVKCVHSFLYFKSRLPPNTKEEEFTSLIKGIIKENTTQEGVKYYSCSYCSKRLTKQNKQGHLFHLHFDQFLKALQDKQGEEKGGGGDVREESNFNSWLDNLLESDVPLRMNASSISVFHSNEDSIEGVEKSKERKTKRKKLEEKERENVAAVEVEIIAEYATINVPIHE